MTELDRLYEELETLLESNYIYLKPEDVNDDIISKALENKCKFLCVAIYDAIKDENGVPHPSEAKNGNDLRVIFLDENGNQSALIKEQGGKNIRTYTNISKLTKSDELTNAFIQKHKKVLSNENNDNKGIKDSLKKASNLFKDSDTQQKIEAQNSAISVQIGADGKPEVSLKESFEIPDFLQKFFEANVSNTLNPYFIDPLRDAFNNKGIEIVKILTGTNPGDIIFIDSKNNSLTPEGLEKMGINLKGLENSENQEKVSAASEYITRNETAEISKDIESRLNKIQNNINKFIHEKNKDIEFTDIKLEGFVEGTYLNEANEKDKDKEETKVASPKGYKGNTEFYLSGKLIIKNTQILNDENQKKEILKNVLEVSSKIACMSLKGISTKQKVKSDDTFTGKEAKKSNYSFLPGKALDPRELKDGEYFLKFSIYITKLTQKRTAGNIINKGFNALAAAGGALHGGGGTRVSV